MTHVEIGARVSHYRIERQLGAGGMGAVYLATDLTLNRPVAIKFLTAAEDAHSRKRLLREAQAVAALDHEGIAAVYEVGEDPTGGDFIVMQYVEGETLAARIRRGPMPASDALRLIGRVAEALVVAHRAGIIHRDLKPQNIIITPAGVPKLLDFGLAQRLESLDLAGEAETASESSTRRSVVGTPSYMSPEQVRNRPLDGRSDVFALGCVLYECLTGRRAFDGETSEEIFGGVLHVDPPAASTLVPELEPAHDALCARLLRKSVSDRFQSAEEVLGALHALEDTVKLTHSHDGIDVSGHVRPGGRWSTPGPSARLARIGIATAVAIVALLAWQWSRTIRLPAAPPDAANYYALGVEALRDGTFALARNNFEEAIKLFPTYVQAYSGLAQAQMELDDQQSASRALLKVYDLVPDRNRLPIDDRLRLEALLASAQRAHAEAIANYRQLVERHPDDAGAWLDLGRANEAAERRQEARAAYDKALTLDRQSPAVHVRLGGLLVKTGKKGEALPHLDEAVRLYGLQGNVEGEAEALLIKGIALNNAGQLADATATFNRVVTLAGDRYLSQRLRAQFDLARVAAQQERPENGIKAAEDALQATANAGLFGIAANGRINYAMLFLRDDPERADAELARALQLAREHGATRTEMRAQLQRATLRTSPADAREALAMAEPLLAFYRQGKYPAEEAQAKNVVSRAKEALGQIEEASQLASDALAVAESIDDPSLVNESLLNLASQFAKLGRLPDAENAFERSADYYRTRQPARLLGYNLVKQAEMLILLGRGQESDAPLAEVERAIAAKADQTASRPRMVARLRALRAVTEGRFAEVDTLAQSARVGDSGAADSHDRSARALAEYAAAQLGQSRVATDTLVAWPAEAGTPEEQCELSFWVAEILRLRQEYSRALEVATNAWQQPAAQVNAELRWRLAALAAVATQAAATENDARMPTPAEAEELEKLKTLWGQYDAAGYFGRADLRPLVERKLP